MKELRGKMRLIGTLIVCLFIGLGAWYGYTVYSEGSVWASSPYNTRSNGTTAHMGDITDRDGNVLAHTASDGTRQYLTNEKSRRALSQTIGDQMGMSGTGVENYYSSTLLNISGSLLDRLRSAFSGEERVGSSIQLTIDGELTAYISSIFPEGKNGAVCLINYKTGEVLAWVSKPDYDPADLLDGSTEGDDIADTAFLNRCLQGLYMPGSTFKIITLASAIEADPNVLSGSSSAPARGITRAAPSSAPAARCMGKWTSSPPLPRAATSPSASSPTSSASSACAPRRRTLASTRTSSSAIS